MNDSLTEIIIPNELNNIYVDSFVWSKQHLDDINHRTKKYVYEECEIRPLFVLEQKDDKLIGLDTSSQQHWSTYEYAVKVGTSYVLCDKIKEVDINFDFPLIDAEKEEFKKDKNNNLIIIHQSIREAKISVTDEQIKEIHDKYNKYLSSSKIDTNSLDTAKINESKENTMAYTKEEIAKGLKEAVEWLIDQDEGCVTIKLDDKLGICVGWLPGYGEEHRDDVIQSKAEPDFAINAGIKVYTSDDMRTDYEFINMPYYENGDVVQTDVSIEPNENYEELAEYFLKEYDGMKDFDIAEDGLIIEKPEDVIEESKKFNSKEFVGKVVTFSPVGFDEEEDAEILKHADEYCTITSVAIEDGGTFEDNYWNIEFPDGSKFDAIQGVSLKECALKEGNSDLEHVAREEYCVIVNGNNEECYDSEEDAIKFARERFVEEGNDSVVKVLLVKYGPKDEHDDEVELGFETVWASSFKEDVKESFSDFKQLADDLSDHMAELGAYYDVWPEEDGLCVEITWGDWKHDHLWCDYEVENFVKSKNHEVVSHDTEIIDEDGSDTYSAIHSYIIK